MSKSSAPEHLPSMEDATTQKLRLLEDVGSAAIDVVHFFLKKTKELPFPLGWSISYVGDTLSPWLDPLIASVEEEGLHLLLLADEKINAASAAAVKHIPLASVFITPLHIVLSGQAPSKVQSGLEKLRRRGVVGFTADAWVKYEPVIRSKSQGIFKVVNKIPGFSLAVCILQDIGLPLVSSVSQWLINHSEMDRHQELFTYNMAERSHFVSSNKGFNDLKTTEDATHSQEYRQEQTPDSQGYAKEDASQYKNISSTPDDRSVISIESCEGSTSEISVLSAEGRNQGSATADDRKGTVLQEEHEEHDEILDLFDTWGLGANAISPKGLENLRTLSSQNRYDRAVNSKAK